MYEDLKQIIKTIDELEKEIWNQQGITQDPKLKEWCALSAKSVTLIKSQLEGYIQKSVEAGDVLT